MEEDTFRTVFYDGPIQDEDSFLAMLQSPSNAPVFAFRGDQIIGFAWLNGFSGSHAFGHFCFLKQAWGDAALEAGRMILEYWLSFPKEDGSPLLQVLIGSVPVTNTLAIAFVHNLGFKRAGSIPKMLHNIHTGEDVSAVILYYVRP